MKKLFLLLALALSFTLTINVNGQAPSRHTNGVVLGDPIGTSGDPTGTKEGQLYWNDTLKKFRQYDGTVWSDLTASAIANEGYIESGTRAGGDLKVTIGDHDASSNGVLISIDDNLEIINLGALGTEVRTLGSLQIRGGYPLHLYETGNTFFASIDQSLLTTGRAFQLPNQAGTFALLSDITNSVTASANLGDNFLIRGDGATKGVQNSAIIISDGNDVSIFEGVDNGNPFIDLGSASAETLKIQTFYNSGTQVLDRVDFTTKTTSGTVNDGRFNFLVDEVQKLLIDDTGINVAGNVSLTGDLVIQGDIAITYDGSNLDIGDTGAAGYETRLFNQSGVSVLETTTTGVNFPLGIELVGVDMTATAAELNLLDGITVLSGSNTGDLMISVKVSLSSAQILSINTTPIEAIAAPGSGKIIIVHSMMSKLTYNSITYSGPAAIQCIYNGTTLGLASNNILTFGADKIVGGSSATNLSMEENTAVDLFAPTSDPTLGNSTIDVYITYQIITL